MPTGRKSKRGAKPNDTPVQRWTKAPFTNLVRYEPSEVYFARIRVHGKLIRRSLDTTVLSVAKLRLPGFTQFTQFLRAIEGSISLTDPRRFLRQQPRQGLQTP